MRPGGGRLLQQFALTLGRMHHVTMNAYSEDLRKKIVEATERGTPKIEVARAFGVGVSSVKRYVASAREGRPLAPKRRPARNRSWTNGPESSWRRISKNARRQFCRRGASSSSGSRG